MLRSILSGQTTSKQRHIDDVVLRLVACLIVLTNSKSRASIDTKCLLDHLLMSYIVFSFLRVLFSSDNFLQSSCSLVI